MVAIESPSDGCDEFGVEDEVDFCGDAVFELTADFWALILAFKLAVYWFVRCTCRGVALRFRKDVGVDELSSRLLSVCRTCCSKFVVLEIAVTDSLIGFDVPLAVPLLPAEAVLVNLLAARLALVVVY